MANGGGRRRWLVFGLAGVLVILALVGLAGRNPDPEVQVAAVSREELDASITSNGKVEPIQAYQLRAQLDAFVTRIATTESQPVRKGQLILSLDVSDARAQFAQAQASLIAAQEDLRAARAGGSPDQAAQLTSDIQKDQAEISSLERTRQALVKLLAVKAASQAEVDQNQLQLDQKRAELQGLQQRLAELNRRASADARIPGGTE